MHARTTVHLRRQELYQERPLVDESTFLVNKGRILSRIAQEVSQVPSIPTTPESRTCFFKSKRGIQLTTAETIQRLSWALSIRKQKLLRDLIEKELPYSTLDWSDTQIQTHFATDAIYLQLTLQLAWLNHLVESSTTTSTTTLSSFPQLLQLLQQLENPVDALSDSNLPSALMIDFERVLFQNQFSKTLVFQQICLYVTKFTQFDYFCSNNTRPEQYLEQIQAEMVQYLVKKYKVSSSVQLKLLELIAEHFIHPLYPFSIANWNSENKYLCGDHV